MTMRNQGIGKRQKGALIGAALLSCVAAMPVISADMTDGGRFFSGVAQDDGTGLIVPYALRSGSQYVADTSIDAGFAGTYVFSGVIALDDGGTISAQRSQPLSVMASGYISLGSDLWGITPYVGAGVSAYPVADGMFAGSSVLLPRDALPMISYQGTAGFTYQFTPSFGAGLEYRYVGASMDPLNPYAALESEEYRSHSIMMRLDLGLN